MPETLSQIQPSFNRSLGIEARSDQLSGDTGALVQREILERTGIIGWLTERLHDPRHPRSILVVFMNGCCGWRPGCCAKGGD